MAERCTFFDQKSGECHRTRILHNSPEMEAIRGLFRAYQISMELMGKVVDELDRNASLARWEGNQRDNWLACQGSVLVDEKPTALSDVQTTCDGYWSLSGHAGPNNPVNRDSKVRDQVTKLLPDHSSFV